ncbi:MAG TPA: hypothetical protein VK104_02755 [Burkholderiaceae bacterium]|nr:hypothetical protein [Burkholderiaceae bacterium]
MKNRLLLIVFWAALLAFFGWDWATSDAIDVFSEPPVLAIGSGQAPSGAHCSNF